MNISNSDIKLVETHIGVTIPEHITASSWGDLRDLRAQLREGSKTLLDKAEADNRDLTPEERQASDAALAVLQTVQDEIENRLSDGRQGPRIIDEPLRPPISNQRGGKMDKIFEPRTTWRSIFGREPRNVEGIKNFGEAVVALHNNDFDKLRELRTLNSIVGEQGAFSVPEAYFASIYDSGVESSVCLDKVQNYPMSTDTLWLPAWSSEDHTGGPIGAVSGSWIGEMQTATPVTPRLRAIKFTAHKLGMWICCSSEVLQDSSALAMALAPLMRNSLAFSLDEAILTGSGVGEPQGILNSPSTIASTRASATDITFADLVAMKGRMLPSSLSKAIFIVSPSAFAVLCGLVITAGTGELVMGYQHGASDMRMSILGHPVRVSEKLPELGSKGDVMLVDLNFYALALREAARFEKTNAVNFMNDCTDFRFIIRGDGHPLIEKPFTPAGGGNTLSPFVVLDA